MMARWAGVLIGLVRGLGLVRAWTLMGWGLLDLVFFLLLATLDMLFMVKKRKLHKLILVLLATRRDDHHIGSAVSVREV